jgi:hypothetical protein
MRALGTVLWQAEPWPRRGVQQQPGQSLQRRARRAGAWQPIASHRAGTFGVQGLRLTHTRRREQEIEVGIVVGAEQVRQVRQAWHIRVGRHGRHASHLLHVLHVRHLLHLLHVRHLLHLRRLSHRRHPQHLRHLRHLRAVLHRYELRRLIEAIAAVVRKILFQHTAQVRGEAVRGIHARLLGGPVQRPRA